MAIAPSEPLRTPEIVAELVTGATVFSPDNQPVGHVTGVLGEGETAFILIESGGLFCLAGRVVVLPLSRVRFQREESGRITAGIDYDRVEFAALPAYRG